MTILTQSPCRPAMSVETPENHQPAVAVVLVNWNGWQHVTECLDTLMAQDYSNFHAFVVDNESHDASVEHIAAWCSNPRPLQGWRRHQGAVRWSELHAGEPVNCRVLDSEPAMPTVTRIATGVTVIRSGGNLGFAGGCNVGIRVASALNFSFFWLLNTDTVVHRGALLALVERAQCDARIGMVGSTIRYYDRPEVVQSLGGASLEPKTMGSHLIGTGSDLSAIPEDSTAVEGQMVYVMGASMLASAAFVRDIGLLREDYFLYGEEIDWALRARGRYRLAYAPGSHVFHKSGATSSQVMPLFTAKYYYRNRIRIVGRFFPEKMGAAKRGLALDLVRHSLKGRWGHMTVVAGALWNAGKLAAAAQLPGGP
jgi:GT2 family glycosyltransferase